MGRETEALNRAMATAGQTVILQRRIGTSDVFDAVTCRAGVRTTQDSDLVEGANQTQSTVIISQTEILASGWPVTAGGVNIPIKGDRILIAGKAKTVEFCKPFDINGEYVRFEIQVRG